jgi:hypothetical protein
MPDKPPAPRIPVAVASAAVLLLCTLVYAVVAALGDAPWAWSRRCWSRPPSTACSPGTGSTGSADSTDPQTPLPLLCHDEGIWAR